MAHVPLVPFGSPRDALVDEETYDRNRSALEEREEELGRRRTRVAEGWGTKYVERVHAKGKLTTRERLDRLRDEGTSLYEVGTFVNWGVDFDGLESPAAGVVTVFCKVAGRWTMVIANDNTVASGSWWPRTPEDRARPGDGPEAAHPGGLPRGLLGPVPA